MAKYPRAEQRSLGGRPEPALAVKNKIIMHTMVGSLDGTDHYFRVLNGPGFEGTESHFGTDPTRVYQWQDTNFQADAQLEGNDDCISVETADHGAAYPSWSGSDVPAWTAAHLEINAQLVAWLCRTHDIPAVLIEDTEHDTRGIGYHRQGIDPWREDGSERYSGSFGKVCPGDRRVQQMPALVARVQEILAGEEDDMAYRDWPQEDKDAMLKDIRQELDSSKSWNHKLLVQIRTLLRTLIGRTRVIAEAVSEIQEVDSEALAEELNRYDTEELAEALLDGTAERLAE